MRRKVAQIMLSLKRLYLGLLMVSCLTIIGSGQCDVVQFTPVEDAGIDFAAIYQEGICGNNCASSSGTVTIFIIEGLFYSCPDEPVQLRLVGGVHSTGKGIQVTYSARGVRSNQLYAAGGKVQFCDGTSNIYDFPRVPCITCEVVIPGESCSDDPGEGSTEASCSTEGKCALSCVNSIAYACMSIQDPCPYTPEDSHAVSAAAFTTRLKAKAEARAFYHGFQRCYFFTEIFCNGYSDTQYQPCSCPR